MNYRPEIDGLRAFAVLPVIFFHAGFKGFSGGFVGVDVFFVISGYLITYIILDDLKNDTFSFVNFYERRARRLLPALYLVMFLCIPFSFLTMMPNQMKDFMQSLSAVSIFSSNFLFWDESGYFEKIAEEKPLLHTWSLAIEEQFYFIFPFIITLVYKVKKKLPILLLISLILLSLMLSIYLSRVSPSTNFYLAPTRFWELIVGSLAAVLIFNYGQKSNNLISLVAMFCLIVSITLFDKNTLLPGLYTLLPVGSTFLLILFCSNNVLVAKLLSLKIFVSVGLISYSLYLWHQPLFAFVRIQHVEKPNMYVFALLILLVFLLSFLSRKFIEQPFRNRNTFTSKFIFKTFLSLSLFFIIFGIVGSETKGFQSLRFSNKTLAVFSTAESSPFRKKCHFEQEEIALQKQPCIYFSENVKVAVLGNSHATELAYSLANLFKNTDKGVVHYTMSGCWHNYLVASEKDSICYRWHDKVLAEIVSNNDIRNVILSYRNEDHLNQKKYIKSLVKMISFLRNNSKKVILVLQAPLAGADIDKYFASNLYNLDNPIKGIQRSVWEKKYNSVVGLKSLLPPDVNIIDPAEIFCKLDNCFVYDGYGAYYFDDDHMSVYGTTKVAKKIYPLIL